MVLLASLLLVSAPEEAFLQQNYNRDESFYRLEYNEDRKRNYWFPPLASFVLPGFDQWWERQYLPAASYSGTALASLVYIGARGRPNRSDMELESEFEDHRDLLLATQIYSAAGGLSAYHSFRTAVESRKPYGEFEFLTEEENPADIALSPFCFDYLLRWTTLIPTATAALLGWVILPRYAEGKRDFSRFGADDAGYAFGHSYLAGAWEEPFFRGYIMPAMYQTSGNRWFANAFQSVLFGLAHITSEDDLKYHLWHHTLWGFYIGWVSQHRNWTVSEPIFAHFMWNLIIFTSVFSWNDSAKYMRLDLLNLSF